MDDKKQIEEMARIICGDYNNGCCENDGWICNYNCVAHNERATALYEQGYRKIPEGSVVLTEKEYEDLKYKESLLSKTALITKEEFLMLLDNYNQARKQAVKEVIEKAEKKSYFKDGGYYDKDRYLLDMQDLKAIAKEFGVEAEICKNTQKHANFENHTSEPDWN